MKKRRMSPGKYAILIILLLAIVHVSTFFVMGDLFLVESKFLENFGPIEDANTGSNYLPVTYGSVSSSHAPNAEERLSIPTYVSQNCYDTVHPDVVDFGNGSAWSGYRYWMAMTPYPRSNNVYENPSIVVSNDPKDWKEPSGIQNPIDKARSPRYNSDTELLYEPDLDRLVCYWRNVDGRETTAFYSYTDDGVNWSSRGECYKGPCLSPSVIRISPNSYQIYVIYNGSILRYTSDQQMASIWNDTNTIVCNMSWLPANTKVWHAKVRFDREHEMYIAAFMLIIKGAIEPTGPLYLAYSTDGKNFTVQQEPTLMCVNSKGWDRDFIYRSTFWICEDTMHIWYSARGGGPGGTWGIGYTSSNLSWNGTISPDIPGEYRDRFLNITQRDRIFNGTVSDIVDDYTDAPDFGDLDPVKDLDPSSIVDVNVVVNACKSLPPEQDVNDTSDDNMSIFTANDIKVLATTFWYNTTDPYLASRSIGEDNLSLPWEPKVSARSDNVTSLPDPALYEPESEMNTDDVLDEIIEIPVEPIENDQDRLVFPILIALAIISMISFVLWVRSLL